PFLGSQNMYFVFIQLLSSGSAWFAIILMVVTCLFLDIIKKVFDRHLHPTSTEKAQMYSNTVALSDEFIALQPLSRARNQLSKLSLLKQMQVSSAWTPCAVSRKEKQRVHLLEECWNEL
ncbi:ATP11B isoform 10, partial [Pan troglodytes]